MPLVDDMLTPLSSLRVSQHVIPRHGRIPNTSIAQKPLLIYHSAFLQRPSAPVIESHLEKVAVVEPQWRYTMYSTSHFHSTTHEVLAISSGWARLLFGGEENPKSVEVKVTVGDVIVVPAGVAHRLMEDIDGGFEMVGSYPKGVAKWDMCYGKDGEEGIDERIKGLKWFQRDPVYGDEGPVLEV